MYANFVDNLGRVAESQSRVVSHRSGSTTYDQWRPNVVTLNAAGQVTSTRVERSPDCTSCTGGTSSWPTLATDTLPTSSAQYDSVYVVYSRLGRDSLRGEHSARPCWSFWMRSAVCVPGTRGTPTIRARWIPSGTISREIFVTSGPGAEPRSSMSTTAATRDTLTSVPGVGTYRNSFAGPNDELTRSWIDSYVDSIGAVNPEVRFVFGQAGQLLSDTSQGTRVVSHRYDRFGRDSVITDVNGDWRMRFDAVRGVPDTILTPFSDTVLYAYDTRGRRNGPTVLAASNPVLSAVQHWSLAGQLDSMTFSHGSYVLGGMTDLDTTDMHTISRMSWSEKHGSGGATVTMEDSLGADGFGRLRAGIHLTGGSVVVRDTFNFDRDGGILLVGESRSYDATNTRMIARAGDSCLYDNAGNDTLAGAWHYQYDALDRLTSVWYVTHHATLVARYAYDVFGRRIVRRVYATGPNNAQTGYFRMIYAGGEATAEADSGGTLKLSYVWGLGADDLVAIHDDSTGSHYYVAQDELGSVRGISKRDGTWQGTLRYRAYGAALDSAGTIPFRLRYRWIGREFDEESGLYYVRARYYDPQQREVHAGRPQRI